MRRVQVIQYLLVSLFFIGCATVAQLQLDQRWGVEQVQEREIAEYVPDVPEYHRDIQPIFDKRCVACHACYDGPCQLKLSSYEGLDRGASKELVYDGTRLLATQPSRLGVDAKTTQAWRDRDYYPVLNERAQIPKANLQGSLLMRMLDQKRQHPLPETAQLDSDEFDFSTSRAQECPTMEEYEGYASSHPYWGMPFGLPAISDEDYQTIERWVAAGSPVKPLSPLGEAYQNEVAKWEAFFNGESNKERLFSRYAYEHLYLGNLWFESLGYTQYFKLVRSRTPSGTEIDEIASRRPFDDPKVERIFYRLKPVRSTIVDKTHMPYMLNDARMAKWSKWFIEPNYEVSQLPSYAPKKASNPFLTFKDLPATARYKFMLDEAEFTIMGYIKGPVCRGQVALNVIEDHFWVFFVDPDIPTMLYDHKPSKGDDARIDHLRMPASDESNASPFRIWTKYAALQEQHLNDKLEYIQSASEKGGALSLDLVWNGDLDDVKGNDNAALTIFRHYDNATVVRGLHGEKPKTAWVISYSLLERIHYLLVAGFDVYGNVGHQLNTRLYMDFLRMEGESNFLMLLPEKAAENEFLHWYEGAEEKVEDYLNILRSTTLPSQISYSTEDQKGELYSKLKDYLGATVVTGLSAIPADAIEGSELPTHLSVLANVRGEALAYFPELSIVRVQSKGKQYAFTMAVNRAHKNVSSLFMEEDRLQPEEHTLTLYPGVLGSYPNTYYDVDEADFAKFVQQVSGVNSDDAYAALLDNFAVRRTNPDFWEFNDWLLASYAEHQPKKAGVIDLNRFENR